ncbi:putative uncharacterized protein DDB_G0282133 [Musca vetustissima]|uniref:putative uncharacterized protein DDB_G0282133 n=1 Tax=Musca vetustissima TaxID=27455 RepID=UPI002AB746F4|nr:putative uncharacterized protein DDB_G0282133 [Musca vetustissima]
MTEVKAEETEVNADNKNTDEEKPKEDTAPPATSEQTTTAAAEDDDKQDEERQQTTPTPQQQQSSSQAPDKEAKEDGATLNPLNNDNDHHSETETKGKNRRYWTPKEEDRFFLIWGRENWRLTKHGKNTIFFAQWAEEMKERFDIDVKPEEVQCKVNQTRAKYRQVKRLLETDRNAVKWKKYDLVEKILKNQYRSKDDEPVPQEALENNRDMSPTELLNSNSGGTRPSSPNVTNSEQSINLNQTPGDNQQLTEDISLTEQNLSSLNVFSNNSNTSFSTELFGLDQIEIKKEIENDLKTEGFSEFIPIDPQELTTTANPSTEGGVASAATSQNASAANQQVLGDLAATTNGTAATAVANNNRSGAVLANHTNVTLGATNNAVDVNHANSNHTTSMEPPRRSSVTSTSTPRKRNRTTSSSVAGTTGGGGGGATSTALTPASSAAAAAAQDSLEHLYLEEIKKKNIILVEQGEINRKRLKLEERKVKLMEDFFPKYLSLQQDILKKLDNLNSNTPESINIRIEENYNDDGFLFPEYHLSTGMDDASSYHSESFYKGAGDSSMDGTATPDLAETMEIKQELNDEVDPIADNGDNGEVYDPKPPESYSNNDSNYPNSSMYNHNRPATTADNGGEYGQKQSGPYSANDNYANPMYNNNRAATSTDNGTYDPNKQSEPYTANDNYAHPMYNHSRSSTATTTTAVDNGDHNRKQSEAYSGNDSYTHPMYNNSRSTTTTPTNSGGHNQKQTESYPANDSYANSMYNNNSRTATTTDNGDDYEPKETETSYSNNDGSYPNPLSNNNKTTTTKTSTPDNREYDPKQSESYSNKDNSYPNSMSSNSRAISATTTTDKPMETARKIEFKKDLYAQLPIEPTTAKQASQNNFRHSNVSNNPKPDLYNRTEPAAKKPCTNASFSHSNKLNNSKTEVYPRTDLSAKQSGINTHYNTHYNKLTNPKLSTQLSGANTTSPHGNKSLNPKTELYTRVPQPVTKQSPVNTAISTNSNKSINPPQPVPDARKFSENTYFLNHLDSILNKLPVYASENLQGNIMAMAYAELAKHRSNPADNRCNSTFLHFN